MSKIDVARLPKIQFITHGSDSYTLAESALIALSCGIKWIQFRAKCEYSPEIIQQAKTVRDLCRQHKALFVIDDQVDLAMLLGADGVHLGKNDMPVAQARKIMGDEFLIGGTANTFQDIEKLYTEGVDYVGLGPYRFTRTKENLSPILGIDGYRNIITEMHQKNIHLPVYAIGGLKPEDTFELRQCGVSGLAISSSILQASDPRAETERFVYEFIRRKDPVKE